MGNKILNWFGFILFFVIVAGVASLPLEETPAAGTDASAPTVETGTSVSAGVSSVQTGGWEEYLAAASTSAAWFQQEEEEEPVQVSATPGPALVFESVSAPSPAPTPTPTPQVTEPDYILNLNTGKFHYPDCHSVDQMNESSKLPYSGTRDEVIQRGYDPCMNCEP